MTVYIGDTEYKVFSIYNIRYPFIYNDNEWLSVYHAYQASKFNDKDHIELIRVEKDFSHVKILSRCNEVERNPDFSKNKIQILREIQTAKLKNRQLSNILAGTFSDIKCLDSKKLKTNYWNSRILTQIRNTI